MVRARIAREANRVASNPSLVRARSSLFDISSIMSVSEDGMGICCFLRVLGMCVATVVCVPRYQLICLPASQPSADSVFDSIANPAPTVYEISRQTCYSS
jgi:hypothetical protein